MKSKLVLSAVVALSALVGCGSTPDRGTGTSQTGGTTSAGGATGLGGSGGGSGGAGSGGASGGVAGDGSGGTTVNTSGGTTVKPSGGASGTASGGTTVNPTGGAAGNSSGGTTVKAGGGSAAGGSQAGGVQSSGGATGLGGATSAGGSTGTAPCDIYGAASTPCVAAHSTVRALYSAYTGPLYQLRKKSDSSVKDVPVGADGFVDISVHNAFCPSGTACTISVLYDQSPNKNDLKKSGTALWLKNGGNEADASLGQITVSGHVAHGIFVDNDGSTTKDVGYRNNATKGVATGDQPEAMYMVLDGKRFSGTCCFDYGNAETTNNDSGSKTMEALYWGNSTQFQKGGAGTGPWFAADLENGMFECDTPNAVCSTNASITWAFATGMLKGPSLNAMGIKAGNAQSGALVTMFNGKRPSGYTPMLKQGAIILGTGGDGSDYGKGTFFEGCMTSGNPPDSADDAVQANIVAAGYGK
jgi:non-reducing end alpha-L-arabinofuranosidase